jgi:hypothetical protein
MDHWQDEAVLRFKDITCLEKLQKLLELRLTGTSPADLTLIRPSLYRRFACHDQKSANDCRMTQPKS